MACQKTGRQEGKGPGKRNFCLPVCPAFSGIGNKKRFRFPMIARTQNRKIFFSLIEKNFCEGAIKKCLENFFVLSVATDDRQTTKILRQDFP
ncbi:MAG: hypothetical protein U9P88_02090 [Patescibacteria group bacterium]|nr:hypothetical protein [Patescibacteria group bacterium]